jgi:hypothetical protein
MHECLDFGGGCINAALVHSNHQFCQKELPKASVKFVPSSL